MPAQQEITLPAVLGDRLLVVPDYQRPYAWEQKQLEDLWEDLDLLGSKGVHYAGTLVLRDVVIDGEAVTSLDHTGTTLRHSEVVDGQQRLTTCLLLLDRVRRRLEGLPPEIEDAAAVAQNLRFSYGVAKVNNAFVPRLKLGTELNQYWVDVVLGEQPHVGGALLGGEARLAQAADFFDEKIRALGEGVSDEVLFTRLRELQRRVTAGLRFLVYEVASVAEVGVIFETLNERGRPLSDLEKAKNYLLYLARQLPDGRQDELVELINTKWSGIFRNLAQAGGDSDLDDQLLRSHWLATQDPVIRSWRRILSLKGRFDRSRYISGSDRLVPSGATASDAEDTFDRLFEEVGAYVRTLHRCSHYLAEMFHPNAAFIDFGDDRDEVIRLSSRLSDSGTVAIYRPLLVAARLRYPKDGKFYGQLVDMCERYSARVFVIAQRRTGAGRAKLASLSYDLYHGIKDRDAVLAALRVLIWQYASDQRLLETFESTTENWYERRGHKYFLHQYEHARMKKGEELPPLSHFMTKGSEQRTTEHILPQHPKTEDACWWDHFTREQHAQLCHNLGNLCLTLDNSKYGRKCFSEKRGVSLGPGVEKAACYAQAPLHQERELALYAEWTPETILQRQSDLAKWALERWHVSPPEAAAVEAETLDLEIEADGDDDPRVD